MLPTKANEIIEEKSHYIRIYFRDCLIDPSTKFFIRCNNDLIRCFPFLHKSYRENNDIIPTLFCTFCVLFDFLRFFWILILLQQHRKEEAQMFYVVFYIIFIFLNVLKLALSLNHGYEIFAFGYGMFLLTVDSWMFPLNYFTVIMDETLLYYILVGMFSGFYLVLDISLMVVVFLNYYYGYTQMDYNKLENKDIPE